MPAVFWEDSRNHLKAPAGHFHVGADLGKRRHLPGLVVPRANAAAEQAVIGERSVAPPESLGVPGVGFYPGIAWRVGHRVAHPRNLVKMLIWGRASPGGQRVSSGVLLRAGAQACEPGGQASVDAQHSGDLGDACAGSGRSSEGGTWRAVPCGGVKPGPALLPGLLAAMGQQLRSHTRTPFVQRHDQGAVSPPQVLLIRQPEKVAADQLARVAVSEPSLLWRRIEAVHPLAGEGPDSPGRRVGVINRPGGVRDREACPQRRGVVPGVEPFDTHPGI